jgi:hypothetical protein
MLVFVTVIVFLCRSLVQNLYSPFFTPERVIVSILSLHSFCPTPSATATVVLMTAVAGNGWQRLSAFPFASFYFPFTLSSLSACGSRYQVD